MMTVHEKHRTVLKFIKYKGSHGDSNTGISTIQISETTVYAGLSASSTLDTKPRVMTNLVEFRKACEQWAGPSFIRLPKLLINNCTKW